MLGLGLLAVDLSTGSISVLAEPSSYRPRTDLKQRSRILKEHTSRTGDPTPGGSTRQPIMTAYRQRAIAYARAISTEPMRPRDLKHLAPDAGAILLRNVYGWFERVRPGLYRLSPEGAAALTAGTIDA